MRDIGKNIRSLRKTKHMTQDQLAEKLFVTRQTVSNYETGRSRPDIEMLMRIAEVMDADIHILLYGPRTDPQIKKKRLFYCVAAIVFALLVLLLCRWLGLAQELKSNYYDATPLFWLHILAVPAAAFTAGWLTVQGLRLFTDFSPVPTKYTRHLHIAVSGLILGYLAIMAPFMLRIADVPAFWVKTALFILGALFPWQLGGGYMFIFFLLGASLRLFRPAGQK